MSPRVALVEAADRRERAHRAPRMPVGVPGRLPAISSCSGSRKPACAATHRGASPASRAIRRSPEPLPPAVGLAREVLEERARRRHERVRLSPRRTASTTCDQPPGRTARDLREADCLVHPVETTKPRPPGRTGRLQLRVLERRASRKSMRAPTVSARYAPARDPARARRRVGSELEQAACRLTGARAHLEHGRARREAAPLDEDVVHARRMTRPRGVVARPDRSRTGADLRRSIDLAPVQSQGGGLCTQRPPTIVATTSTESSSSPGQSTRSRERTTRSAR